MKKFAIAMLVSVLTAAAAAAAPPTPVTVKNFARAETDRYFAESVKEGGFGKLHHRRQLTAIDRQPVVRMNRDTLYSTGVFDLQAGPLTITMPDAGRRYMSLHVISQDHDVIDVAHRGTRTYTQAKAGTRYVYVIVRTLVDPRDAADIDRVHVLQDAIQTRQPAIGVYVPTDWDKPSLDKARQALKALQSLGDDSELFGAKGRVDPVSHLMGTAGGWGGLPRTEADYIRSFPAANDGKTVHVLNLKDVPVDGFWSVSVYDAGGYFQKNALDAYTLNSITAQKAAEGSYRIQFGDCRPETVNCLPITPGWNYTLRLYQPRKAVLDRKWTAPVAQPIN